MEILNYINGLNDLHKRQSAINYCADWEEAFGSYVRMEPHEFATEYGEIYEEDVISVVPKKMFVKYLDTLLKEQYDNLEVGTADKYVTHFIKDDNW